jgi:hypothetical protein
MFLWRCERSWRVLRPTGTLVISIVHPFADRGRFAGPEQVQHLLSKTLISVVNASRWAAERDGFQTHFAGGHNL